MPGTQPERAVGPSHPGVSLSTCRRPRRGQSGSALGRDDGGLRRKVTAMEISLGSCGVGRSAAPMRHRWRRGLVWILAAFAAVGGVGLVYRSAAVPREVASDPVRVEAQVSDVYINGFGGDPGVDYRYRAAGREYSGSGDGALGQENLLDLHPGDPVAIEYARGDPSRSCTCNARSDQPVSMPAAIAIAVVLLAPLAALSVGNLRRRRPLRTTQ